MKTEELGNSRLVNLLFKPAGVAMESSLRRVLHNPLRILNGADVQPGQTVLEVGSGTGFFTMPAARLLGDHGHLIAMEPLSGYAERLTRRIHAAGLQNVDVLQRDALATQLETASIDRALLFGVLPFPSLPLNRLLPEMHRILKPDGSLAVWLFPVPGWVPRSIRGSGLFDNQQKRNNVYSYRRCSTDIET